MMKRTVLSVLLFVALGACASSPTSSNDGTQVGLPPLARLHRPLDGECRLASMASKPGRHSATRMHNDYFRIMTPEERAFRHLIEPWEIDFDCASRTEQPPTHGGRPDATDPVGVAVAIVRKYSTGPCDGFEEAVATLDAIKDSPLIERRLSRQFITFPEAAYIAGFLNNSCGGARLETWRHVDDAIGSGSMAANMFGQTLAAEDRRQLLPASAGPP